MPEVIPLRVWYPAMYDKWQTRLADLHRQGVKVRYELDERRAWIHHHTVGGTSSDPLSYARQVANQHWNQWRRPGGYNFLVGTDGRLREMCGWHSVGVHSGTHYWNRHGLGLAYQGDFRTRPPSDRMLDAARELIAEHPIRQTTHRAVRPKFTTCPGDALIRLLPLEADVMTPEQEAKLDRALALLDRLPIGVWRAYPGVPKDDDGLSAYQTLIRIQAAVSADDLDEAEVAQLVLAGLPVSAIADALGSELGRDVADEIDRRARERLG